MPDTLTLPRKVSLGVLIAVIASVINLAFSGGVYVMVIAGHTEDIRENREAIKQLRSDTDRTRETLIRIDANVEYLAERAREDRERWLK